MRDQTEMWWPWFILSTAVLTILLALTATTARAGNTPLLFTYMLLTWLSYMAAHRAATGKFIDGKTSEKQKDDDKDEKMAPKDLAENNGFLIGSTIFIAGMITGAYGIHLLQLPLTLAGALLFNTGYITAHYSTTGELL